MALFLGLRGTLGVKRAVALDDRRLGALDPGELLVGGLEGIARRVVAGVRGLAPQALDLQALAVLGDGCELRHAAASAGLGMADATRPAAGLVRFEVLAADDPPRFIRSVVRAALEELELGSGESDAAHRSAARLLHADGAPSGQVAAHLVGVRGAGDPWVLARLEEAA